MSHGDWASEPGVDPGTHGSLLASDARGITEDEAVALRDRLLAKADGMERTAGLSDSRTDGGAGALRSAVRAFDAGWAQECPAAWLPDLATIRHEADPEWAEFQRLKAKFDA